MKKLNLLKAIIDYVWTISLICYPLIIIITGIMFATGEPTGIDFKIFGTKIAPNSIQGKYLLIFGLISFGIFLYTIFNLRKLLRNFQNLVIFEDANFILLKRIGQLIIGASILQIASDIIYQMMNNIIEIQFGFGPFIYLLALGLFFIVLAEVFRVGKNLKEDHDLTI